MLRADNIEYRKNFDLFLRVDCTMGEFCRDFFVEWRVDDLMIISP